MAKANVLKRESKGGGGRPTREEAFRRDEHLLRVASDLFMVRGFEGTSIDAVADAAGISKPTVYGRYLDKADLFAAVLRDRIRKWLAPISAAAEAAQARSPSKSIEEVLHELSRHLISRATTSDAATLQRILAAQAHRFPELARLAHEDGWMRGVRAVAALLRQYEAAGEISIGHAEMTAELFLTLVVGHSKRLLLLGIPDSPRSRERHRKAAVDLFLMGVKPR